MSSMECYENTLMFWCHGVRGGWVVQLAHFIDFGMLGNLLSLICFHKTCCDISVKFYFFGFDFLFSCMLNFIVCPTWTTRTVQHTHASMAPWASFSTALTVSHPIFDGVVEESFHREPLSVPVENLSFKSLTQSISNLMFWRGDC